MIVIRQTMKPSKVLRKLQLIGCPSPYGKQKRRTVVRLNKKGLSHDKKSLFYN